MGSSCLTIQEHTLSGEGVVIRPAKVLLVDDEPSIREMIDYALTGAGFECSVADSAERAREEIVRFRPDLVLLDWMLPGMSGMDFARQLKEDAATRSLPIIMLTARADEADKVHGLGAGADDYVTKPFSPKELVARIKAVLRRAAPDIPVAAVEIAGLRLDPETRRVTAAHQVIALGPTEFQLLHYLMTHPERVFSRAQLIQQVWDNNVHVEERTVDVHIRRLRKALEPSGHNRVIQTVRGTGYRFSTRT